MTREVQRIAIHAAVKITEGTHTYQCGASGQIAYLADGTAWSVNSMNGRDVADWRYQLDWQTRGEVSNRCHECERHVAAAAKARVMRTYGVCGGSSSKIHAGRDGKSTCRTVRGWGQSIRATVDEDADTMTCATALFRARITPDRLCRACVGGGTIEAALTDMHRETKGNAQ